MSNSPDEMMIPPKTKRGRHGESVNEENKDRLSDLPECIVLHILSFLNAKHAVRTCILSTRWKDLWKRLPTLILHSPDFSTFVDFTKFVSRILTLRDASITLHTLDFSRAGFVEPYLVKRIVKYVVSHNVQRLGISVVCDIERILPRFSSSQTLTSLKLSVVPRKGGSSLFPKSVNLPALTSLDLEYFAFCTSDNGLVEPFSTFNRLNTLILRCCCTMRGAQTFCISSVTLVNLTMHRNCSTFSKIELSAPSLCTVAFTGTPYQKLCGSNLSSVKQVNIDAHMLSNYSESPLVLLSWLQELRNMKSLTVTASTLQMLSLVPDLLKVKLLSLCNLKSLKVELKPLWFGTFMRDRAAELWKAAAESRKEAAKLLKALRAGLEPSSPLPDEIPDGIVDFLLQNSPSAKIDIIDFSK